VSFASLLDHVVHVERRVETGASDELNYPVLATEVGGPFRASIQHKRAFEVALLAQGGATVGDYNIYCSPRVISSSDVIVHDPTECPKDPERDLPSARFEVYGVPVNAAGRGHHLEIDARLVGGLVAVDGS